MKWSDIEKKLDEGKRQFVFVTKPYCGSFRIYNYSTSSTVNSVLCLFDIWGKNASCSFLYKEKFGVEGYEISKEAYEFFHSDMMRRAFNRLDVLLVFEDRLEPEDK